ncbi:MAG: OB-fold domain-containing protein [Bacteroidetes bacterium]|nr:OB-fold domain-containing protein [Bacteroidota bacterium]
MSDIQSYGIAWPRFRIEDSMLNPSTGRKGVTRAICFSDEDVMTLAFESSINCLAKSQISDLKSQIDGVFFATSSPVFRNRYHASFLADLLNLPQGILAVDFLNSSRSGTDALLLANELVDTGKYRNILVVASDVDFPSIGKETATSFGHAACSVLLSREKGMAKITSAQSFSSSVAEEFSYKKKNIQQDPRFSRDAGFKTNLASALKKFVSTPASFDAVILNSLYARLAGAVFAKAGFEERQFTKDSLSQKIGNTDAVHALLLLMNEMENEKKNILLADYTNGTNFFEIKNHCSLTEKILQNQLPEFELINSYQDYLLLRKAGNFESLKYETKEMFSSEMMYEREKESLIYLEGLKCAGCETVYYLETTRCKKCMGEKFSGVQLSKTGTVYAFTHEHYFPSSFPPITMAVVDLDGGGRITVQQTDTMYPERNKLEIGSRVKLVLRKMIENGSKPDYFWKIVLINNS